MNDLLFSICVPVYNVEKYVSECIESVLNQSYRNLFYYRISLKKSITKFLFKSYPLFFLNVSDKNIGRNQFVLNHPYGTIINAKSIGDNFTCCQLTTIGNKIHGRNDLVPTIGNNVRLGASVTIMEMLPLGIM